MINSLKEIVGRKNLLTGDDVSNRNEDWGRHKPSAARALVKPASTEELSAVMALCHERAQAVVIHGGLTGLAQGAVSTPNEIVVSLERMKGIEALDVDNRAMTVWAGTPLQEVQEKASEHKLHFALDLGARGTATIGGNIATNAGGLSVIRYGMMRDQVLGLEAVLGDGSIVSSMNALIKNNSGYDLKHLFIGTEGTLGIVTKAVLRLRPAFSDYATALIAVSSYDSIIRLLHALDRDLAGSLLAFEVMWNNFYVAMTREVTGRSAPLSKEYPFYILLESGLIQCERDKEKFQDILMGLMEEGLIVDAVIAKSDLERRELWAIREDVENIFNLGAMVNFDISLPIGVIPDYLAVVERDIKKFNKDTIFIEFGHLGDNNLHLTVSADDASQESQKKIKDIVYSRLEGLGGGVSAEHGIGLEKIKYLPVSRSENEINLMRLLKKALDPKSILNPGKVLGVLPDV